MFKVEAIDEKCAHRYRESTGNNHKGFPESRTALDHIVFLVDEHSDLEAWMVRLEKPRIKRTPIRHQQEPFTCSAMTFRNPDCV
ncbi:hypothetical protein ACJ6WD_08005 [Streptomyces sp. VTCC 41912]|uniref:hypothetical protein n=1 Tax=Streptomyces TaxID=1883 RepID=UPI002F26C352